MSMTEIMDELPKLTHLQRRELCQRIVELEAHSEEIAACDATAAEAFAILDEMEAQDASHA